MLAYALIPALLRLMQEDLNSRLTWAVCLKEEENLRGISTQTAGGYEIVHFNKQPLSHHQPVLGKENVVQVHGALPIRKDKTL